MYPSYTPEQKSYKDSTVNGDKFPDSNFLQKQQIVQVLYENIVNSRLNI